MLPSASMVIQYRGASLLTMRPKRTASSANSSDSRIANIFSARPRRSCIASSSVNRTRLVDPPGTSVTPMAQFAHNNWPSDTTRKSPFFLMMGYDPHADWCNTTSPLPQVTLRLGQLKKARDNAQALMIKAQQSCSHGSNTEMRPSTKKVT